MKRKVLGKTSLRVSEVALGGRGLCSLVWKESVAMIYQAMEEGINFIDTSADIRTSEDRVGDAFLITRPGMHVFFSTRATGDNVQDMAASITTSLGQLKRKAIDLYSIGGMTAENLEQLTGPRGPLAALTKAKNGKKIKYLGFETEDVDVGIELLDNMVFDVALIPAGTAALPFLEGTFMKKARKSGIGILALEPEDTEGYDRLESIRTLKKYGNVVPVIDVRSTTELEDLVRLFGNKPRIFEEQFGVTAETADNDNEGDIDNDTATADSADTDDTVTADVHMPRLANRWQERKPAWLQGNDAPADDTAWPVTNGSNRIWLTRNDEKIQDSAKYSGGPSLSGHAGRPWLKN